MGRLVVLAATAACAAALTTKVTEAQIPFPVLVPVPVPVPVPSGVVKKLLAQVPQVAAPHKNGAKRSNSSYYWSGKNGDLARSGASPHTAPTKLEAGPAWSWHGKGANTLVRAAPLVDGEMNIYLATIAGHVHKFSKDGEHLWNFADLSSIPDVPAMAEGALYVTNDRGDITALDMETGRVRWKVHPGLRTAGDTWSMSAGEGTVVAAMALGAGDNNHLVAVDAKTGRFKWAFRADSTVYNSLQSIKNGSLYFSDFTGKLYNVDLETGKARWKVGPGRKGETVSPVMTTGGTALGPNNVLYVTSNAGTAMQPPQVNGFVTAFSPGGDVLWRKSTEYMAMNAPAIGPLGEGGRLAVVVGVGANPDMPYQQLFGAKDNDVRTKTKDGRVLALDALTGEEIWRFQMPKWHGAAAGDTMLPEHICLPDSFGNPAISGDGTVYVGFENGHFYAINDRNGDGNIDEKSGEVSTYDTGNAFQGSPAIAPGMVVATPCNGMYVFKSM